MYCYVWKSAAFIVQFLASSTDGRVLLARKDPLHEVKSKHRIPSGGYVNLLFEDINRVFIDLWHNNNNIIRSQIDTAVHRYTVRDPWRNIA